MDEALQLPVAVTPHTAVAVTALRRARASVPCSGSVCRALDVTDPAGDLETDAYGEAVEALDVAARVSGMGARPRWAPTTRTRRSCSTSPSTT
jgi:hypothetical protein